MAVLDELRAFLVARAGAARCAATRAGFAPIDTAQKTTGAVGPFYMWAEVTLPTTVWTTVTE